MLQRYIVLLAILVLAFILWRRGAPVLAIAALVVGIPLWMEIRTSNVDNRPHHARGKATLVALLAVEAAKERLWTLLREAEAALAPFGARAITLLETVRFAAHRRS